MFYVFVFHYKDDDLECADTFTTKCSLFWFWFFTMVLSLLQTGVRACEGLLLWHGIVREEQGEAAGQATW